MRPHMSLVLIGVCVAAFAASPARAVDVTTCGQTVPAGESGILVGDLDCSGAAAGSDGVTLRRGASLDLQGHTLVGPEWTNEAQNGAVRCRFGVEKCRVGADGHAKCRYPGGACRVFSSVGTGTITGGAVGVYSHHHMALENLAIQVANAGVFLNTGGKLTATNVDVASSMGIYGGDMTLTNVSVTGSAEYGIWALLGGKVRGSNVTANDNLRGGIAAGKVQLTGVTATGNGGTAFGGAGGGIFAGRMALTDATVTGNTYVGEPTDLMAGSLPKLANTTCGTSVNIRADGESWGVCTDD